MTVEAPSKHSATPPTPRKTAGRPRKDENPKDAALGPDRIFQATLELIDTEGLAAFNIRRLATHLGVASSAIHWHVPTRDGLITGAVALAFQDLAIAMPPGPWQQRIATLMRRFREILRQHPNIAPVVAHELAGNAAFDPALLELILSALEDAGFADQALVDAYNVIAAGMCGFATLELSSAPPHQAPLLEQACKQRIDAIHPQVYPALSRHQARLADRAFLIRWSSGIHSPLNSGFDAWVDTIVQGLEARLSANRRKTA